MLKKIKTCFLMSLLLMLQILSACTISKPFKQTKELKTLPKNQVVIVGLTYAAIKKDQKKHVFWDNVESIIKSLDDQPGFLGYSVRRGLLGNEAWTMTVWKDKNSLQSFISSDAHVKAMKEGSTVIKKASFHNFKTEVKNIPISWKEAINLLDQNGRSYSY